MSLLPPAKQFTITCLLAVTCSASALGGLVQVTDPGSPGGPNNVTRDTVTGLDWLDWSASTNISWNGMVPQLAPGGNYAGWRHATSAEARDFIAKFGVPTTNWPALTTVMDSGAAGSSFGSVVGTTFGNASIGILQDDAIPGVSKRQARVEFSLGQFGFSASQGADQVANFFLCACRGHALVRVTPAAVPEPSPFYCLLLAFVVGMSARKRRPGRQA